MGTFWNLTTRNSNQCILFTEKFLTTATALGNVTNAVIGLNYQSSVTAGCRFSGVPTTGSFTIFGKATTELDYTRHRTSQDANAGLVAKGRVNIAFADGHVATFAEGDLADPISNPVPKSRFAALWSPYDYQIP